MPVIATSTVVTATLPPTTGLVNNGVCTATYENYLWQSLAQFRPIIIVTAGTAIKGWEVSWTFADGQTITSTFSGAELVQTGADVTATNDSSDGTLAAGASTSFTYTGNGSLTDDDTPPLTCAATS
jgi:mannan endo-1,4-beta-mannosidase